MPGAYELIRPHVPTGETLLWAGFPRQGLVLRGRDLWQVPFAFVATAFPAYSAWDALTSPALDATKAFLGVFSIAVTVVGLYLLVGRFLLDSRNRAGLAYGVTDRTVLIVGGLFGSTVTAIDVDSIEALRIDEINGRGTIHFADSLPLSASNGVDMWHPSIGHPPMLFEIESPRKVVGLIRRAMQPQRASARV